MRGLALLLALSAPAAAADAPAPSPELREMAPVRAAPGWTKQPSSLLLYGEDGGLNQELPLRSPDESGTVTRETLGGASPDGRLAWTLDRKVIWTLGRTKVLESQRVLKLYGTSGQELWREETADTPERGAIVQFSSDGKVILLARRNDAGWFAEARTWLGVPLAAVGPFPRLITVSLTPNGRFILARWSVPDKSDTHSFLDLATKTRKDVASSDLLLGLARIGDDGVVRSGSRVVLSFDVSASSGTKP